jgi:hypothetical protein
LDWEFPGRYALFFWRIKMARNTDVAAAYRAATITPSDATVIPPTRAIYVGVTGDITVRMAGNGANQTFANVPVGVFPIQVDMVLSTGTDATTMVALY